MSCRNMLLKLLDGAAHMDFPSVCDGLTFVSCPLAAVCKIPHLIYNQLLTQPAASQLHVGVISDILVLR